MPDPTPDDWLAIQTRLRAAGAEVQELAEEAVKLVGAIPLNDPDVPRFDPRKTTVAAAQFVTALNYAGQELTRKADSIKIEAPDA